jgi:cobalt-zinc-cadmium efflux system outer membrane protein
LTIPDITLGASYDQRGSAYDNMFSLSMSIPIPLLNRNQGNIEAAEAMYSQITIQLELKRSEIQQDIRQAHENYQYALLNHQFSNSQLESNLDEVYRSTLDNFRRGNISMIDFTDFMESYYQSTIEINQARKTFILACEQLNYSTNETLF